MCGECIKNHVASGGRLIDGENRWGVSEAELDKVRLAAESVGGRQGEAEKARVVYSGPDTSLEGMFGAASNTNRKVNDIFVARRRIKPSNQIARLRRVPALR